MSQATLLFGIASYAITIVGCVTMIISDARKGKAMLAGYITAIIGLFLVAAWILMVTSDIDVSTLRWGR